MQLESSSGGFNVRQTKRLTHLAPLQVLVMGITINSLFVGASLLVLGYIERSIPIAISGPLIILLAFAFRTLIQYWINQSKITRSATAVAFAYMAALFTVTLLIRDPLIVPLIIIQSVLPILAGVLYDLRFTPALMLAAIVLYFLLLIGLLTPLPTHLPLDNDARIILLLNSLFLGTERVMNTYRVMYLVFAEQANESQSRLEMLRVLESDLRLRNVQLEHAAKNFGRSEPRQDPVSATHEPRAAFSAQYGHWY